MSGNLKESSQSQGICQKKSRNLRQNSTSQGKVKEFCCLKFIFSQVEDPNFETFLGEHAKWSQTHGRAYTGLEKSGKKGKSGNFILSGKLHPCFKTIIY